MRPDGKGTDYRDPPGYRRPRSKSTNSLERDVFRLAVAFIVLALIGCGAVWLSKRQYLPSDDANSTQQAP